MDKVTIFRIRNDVTDPDKIIPKRQRLRAIDVRVERTHFGVLYIKRSELRPPSWIRYFDGAADFSGIHLRTAATGAVLLVSRKNGIFAVVFGYGRYLIDPEAISGRFGLVVALNTIDPARLRSLDHKRLESVARHTREHISREGDLKFFGLDVERDLLRGVTGAPSDASLGLRLTGAESLSIVGDLPLRILGEKLDRFDELAKDDAYKKSFPWVDNIREVANPSLTRELDARLVTLVRQNEIEIWLTPPEVLDWSTVRGFRYRNSRTATVYSDVDLSEYYDELGNNLDFSLTRLRADRLYLLSAESDEPVASWSIYRCIVAEVQQGGHQFVLSEGKWYQIESSFLASVEDAVRKMPVGGYQYPPYRTKNEENYNRAAADKSDGELVCLDQNFVIFPPRGKIEVCDLYARSRTFVHVKRCGASSVLSHLFSQATVSAELMLYEANFRKAVSDKLPVTHRWGDPLKALEREQFEISLAIVARKGKALELPFFSKVNLRNTARTLQAWGFRVSFAEIKNP
jgi:uncharacterized protein (TIGR04141 family)